MASVSPVDSWVRFVSVLLAWSFGGSVPMLTAATYYVAVDGDDAASGAMNAPFATIQRAHAIAAPGDTVLIRGGTYRMTDTHISKHVGPYDCVTFLERSGTPGNRINYWAHPGERPVFDFSAVKPVGRRVTAFRVHGSWLHLKGIEVVGMQVTITTHTQSICFDNQAATTSTSYYACTTAWPSACGSATGRTISS